MSDTATRAAVVTARVFYRDLAQRRVLCYVFCVSPLRRAFGLLALLLVVSAPAAAEAQVFLASRSHPDFAIGPLFVVVNVRPDLGPVTVTISWSLTPQPGRRASDIKQDLFLLWPGELAEATAPGPADAAVLRDIQDRGFVVTTSGRLVLRSRDRMQMGTGTPAEHDLEIELDGGRVSAVLRRQRATG
jgi:hypothetical protein